MLALKAVQQLPPGERPGVVGAKAAPSQAGTYQPLSSFPITATISPSPQFHFDRDVHFGFRNSLTYEIVVDWVIAEHKSQGLFQTKSGQDRFENFWVFVQPGTLSASRSAVIFERISGPPQPAGSLHRSKL